MTVQASRRGGNARPVVYEDRCRAASDDIEGQRRRLRDRGSEAIDPDIRPELFLQVREMRRHGCSLREVANYFGVSKATVEKWLKQSATMALPELPPPPSPHYQLERDLRVGVLVVRRRQDCARLRSCESEWIERQGARQAQCPSVCPGVTREQLVRGEQLTRYSKPS